jgi:tryptophan-rich sensory protein
MEFRAFSSHQRNLDARELLWDTEIASPGQLRVAFARWALVTVPAILLLGILSGMMGNVGAGNIWYGTLAKPAFMPPGWLFGLAWTILYGVMGFALAMILNARGARGQLWAIAAFAIQLLLNLAWTPLFFGFHQVMPAFLLIVTLFVLVAITTALFWRIRVLAGALMLLCLAWLAFVAVLNWQILALNPNADGLAPRGGDTQIAL